MGIFGTPPEVAQKAQVPLVFFLAWGVGTFISFIGALTFAEIGADAVKKATEGAKKDSADFATALKHDVLEAQMAMMTSEQRAEFAKKAAEIAARDSVTKAE